MQISIPEGLKPGDKFTVAAPSKCAECGVMKVAAHYSKTQRGKGPEKNVCKACIESRTKKKNGNSKAPVTAKERPGNDKDVAFDMERLDAVLGQKQQRKAKKAPCARAPGRALQSALRRLTASGLAPRTLRTLRTLCMHPRRHHHLWAWCPARSCLRRDRRGGPHLPLSTSGGLGGGAGRGAGRDGSRARPTPLVAARAAQERSACYAA